MNLVQRIARRLADRWFPTEPSGLEALFTFDGDDSAYRADTRALAAFHARRQPAVAERCPEIGCLTCSPVHHPADVTRAVWWLRERYAHVWYFAPHDEVVAHAKALLTLQRDFQRGRWGRR